MNQRIKCTFSYDGTNFKGYQVQPNKRTIQEELEKALKKLHKGHAVQTFASGRTDTGVHAYGQVIHFDSNLNIPVDRWPTVLNTLLPNDIVMLDAEEVPDTFHSRYTVSKKEYRYFVYKDKYRDVFRRNYAFFYPYNLDITMMQNAMQFLIGTHDFTSFSSAKTDIENKVRTMYEMSCTVEAGDIVFRFVGNGFLRHMVRIFVGTLLQVGRGRMTPEDIRRILEERDRETAGHTVPGHGLYLWKVSYEEE